MQKPAGFPPKGATIKDVAREAGVSITTVSNVLNGRAGAMSSETMARVNAVIATLSYRPSSAARFLVTGRAARIAIVVAGPGNPDLFPAIATMEHLASEAGYSTTLVISRIGEIQGKASSLIDGSQVAGVLVVSASGDLPDDDVLPLRQSGLPLVLLNAHSASPDAVQVAWDDAGGVSAAVAHLVEVGHRRIAFLGDVTDALSNERRRQGYLGAMADQGLRPHDEWIKTCSLDASRERWRKTLTELVSAPPRPTAAIAANDSIAAVAMRELQRMGVRIPTDFGLIGVGGSDFAPFLSPPLTTVKLPVPEAGRCAAEMLLEMIAGGQAGGQNVLLPCPLVVRESCGAGSKPGASTPEQPILQRPLW